jgi:hypothetical protein
VQVVVELVEGLLDARVAQVVTEIRPNWDQLPSGRLDEVTVGGHVGQVWISDTDIRNHKQGRSQQEKQASNY